AFRCEHDPMTSRAASPTAKSSARLSARPSPKPSDPAHAPSNETPKSPGKASFGNVFKVREFRALWASQILSVGGDRLALVALTLLIYDRTHSPMLAAVAYAAGNVPYILGALFLSGLADRFPRRGVMVTCDLIRAALVITMLVPGTPLAALVVLL